VLHVLDLKCGLMSLNTLALAGLNSTITKDGYTVLDGNFRIHSQIRNELCVWSQSAGGGVDDEDVKALFAGVVKKLSLTNLHERLGHISKNTLLKYGELAIEGLYLDPANTCNEDLTLCAFYVLGKHAHSPFPSCQNRRVYPLELVHSDLAESNIKSVRGGKYVLTFMDDATNHTSIYVLPNISSLIVLQAFKEYQAWAERQRGRQIKEIRTDRGKEYMGEMIKYVKSQGIKYNPTAGYSPQSNGIAERMNRTLFEMACTMLDSSGAPIDLWAEAIIAATHIRNRLPLYMLDGKSPH
jgi:transposase InsO family protein